MICMHNRNKAWIITELLTTKEFHEFCGFCLIYFLLVFFREKMLWTVNKFVKIGNEQTKRIQNLIPTFGTSKSPYSREIWTFLWSYLTTRNNYAAWNKTWDMIKGVPFRSIFDAWKKTIIFFRRKPVKCFAALWKWSFSTQLYE